MSVSSSAPHEAVVPEAIAPRHRPRGPAPAAPRSLWQPLARILVAAATCAVLIALSVAFVDRPVATWVHEHLGDQRFGWFTSSYDGHMLAVGPFSVMASPAQALGLIAVVVIGVAAMLAATGWRPKMRGRIVLTISLAIFAAKEVNSVAKSAFGRTWPESWLGDNRSWINDGVFGFFPFHGGSGWGSFPSGHATVITTFATLLWVVWPELRVVWAASVAVVVAGLIGANYHFVSDVIGGVYLGAAVGFAIAKLMLLPGDHLNWSIIRKVAPPLELTLPARDELRGPPDQT